MPRLLACPSCSSYILPDEERCPFCARRVSFPVHLIASAFVVGAALSACASEDLYGVPETTGPASTTSGATDVTDTEPGEGSSGGPMTEGVTTDASSSSTGGSDSGSGSDTGSTSISPDYGVPTTGSTSLAPEYGLPSTGG